MIVVEDLSVTVPGGATLLEPISLRVPEGGVTALRGPSGCGKSTLMKALLGQVPAGTTAAGTVRVGGHDVLALDPVALRRFRREQIAFVGQDPGVALNPTMRVRSLLGELADHTRSLEALAAVELPESYLRRRAAELSGGEQRRIALARALARRTPVLVLDEPLAGLHGRLRTAVVRLLRRLSDDGTTVVISGHNTAALHELTGHQVMVGGEPLSGVEARSANSLPPESNSNGTGGRILPARISNATPAAESNGHGVGGNGVAGHVLSMSGVGVAIGRRPVLEDIDLRLSPGEALAVAGPSGAGKSTLARAAVGLRRPVAGSVHVEGRIALVPQDSAGSLNPRRTVAQTLSRPLRRHRRVRGSEVAGATADLLRTVELNPELAQRYPHELSGGQRQRVALARALTLDPAALVCDEITSALDHDTATAIMTLLDRLRRERHLALLVITHDMDVVSRYCTRMSVLESGRIVEAGPVPGILAAPTHDATLALLG
ncbi:ABC transporter ATP-binding protein [Nocardia wallacei]|uniref:ABC transporter ATP-binding protein n=1 Tax=Nocardia wallacei TaxID=480035 RepID=UPI002456BAB6|nr:ATP-binding cassette domain-containing protein [Nocardia wallacei]